MYSETTNLLEYVLSINLDSEELCEELFFSYVRENKLLKQQNQALQLYKTFQRDIHAQWAVESMYLISLNLKFETKILDIAYLLMLKLMKEPLFNIDKKFILLYLKILSKQGKFREALDFIELKAEFFSDKIERQNLEAELYLQSNNPILTINVYFNMLRLNSHINHYQEMWDTYKTCIRLIINDFLPKQKQYEYKPNIDYLLNQSDTKGINFDPVTVEDKPEDILLNLISSIKNLRKNVVADTTSKKMVDLANSIKRTSYLAEMEFKFCIAINCRGYPCHEGSPMFNVLLDYIELFYDKADVVCDIMPYIKLFQIEEAGSLREKVKIKVQNLESGYNSNQNQPPDIKLIRWKICLFKLSKILGMYSHLDKQEKLRLVNNIMQTYLHGFSQSEQEMNEVDYKNLEDLVIISVELLNDVKQYEPSVLNPINFMQISILEYALKRSPYNKTFTAWLMKLYSKLGLTSIVSDLTKSIQKVDQSDYEKLGCIRFSHYSEYGVDKDLEQVCKQYKRHYELNFNENKNRVVQCFQQREFDKINEIMTKNDSLNQSYFMVCSEIGLIYLNIFRNANNSQNLHNIFNRQFGPINEVCDEDNLQDMSKRDLDIKSFEALKLGAPREQIKEEAFIEATYDKEQAKLKRDQDKEKRSKLDKKNIRVFGYKYPKVLKFMGQVMRCLKDCYEQKFEQLNIDMNYFLLLKNELSLAFLRKFENIISVVKSAIKIYASQEELQRRELESQELQALEKIIKNQLAQLKDQAQEKQQQEELKGGDADGQAYQQQSQDQVTYEKIVNKLIEYNEKINEGKELSAIEYLKRIDMNSPFIKDYENQRHLRRAFYEEFKIHSFNYILLLFESVMRILTTINKDGDQEEEEVKGGSKKKKKADKLHYYSKNYKRFLENRQKKIDKFIVNCIGWNHIHRCVEVIEMTMRDLIYKIVPTKVIIRELRTSSGKVLTKDSEYTLVERKRYVTVGKKTHVDYIFELDLKEDVNKAKEEAEQQSQAEKEKKQNVFYLNLEEFNLFKLRSAIFLIMFPLTFSIAVINLWAKVIPSGFKKDGEEFTKQDQEQITLTRHAIREFVVNLVTHLKHLHEYLSNIHRERALAENFNQINLKPEFQAFKEVFAKTKGSGLTALKTEEFFIQSFEKINDSFQLTLEGVIKTLEDKINEIKSINLKGNN
eukprot:403375452